MLFIIAWRNLWRNRTRSVLIASSVALGMWAGLFIMAIYFGMGDSRLRIAIDNEHSHIQIHHPRFADDFEAQYSLPFDSLNRILQQKPEVKAFSLRSLTTGMVATASGSQGIQVNGINPGAEQATRGLAAFVTEGEYLDTERRHPVLVSTKLAEKMKLKTGGKVVLTLLDTASNMTSGAFRICGLYRTTNAPMDELNVFVQKDDLDQLIGTSGRLHEAAVLLHRDDALDPVFHRLQRQWKGYRIERWQEISPETALVLSSLDTYSIIFIAIILVALSFGIINTMLMAVLERTPEIGVLMAVGMNRWRVFRMVVWETVLLAVTGAPAGLLAAWITVAWLHHTGIDLGGIMGDTLRNFGYASIIYPILPWHNVLQTMELVLLTAAIAAMFPAFKALRLKPVEAIRK
ncbi:MAG: ABC transporter permease [Saprospirales bacterium]|nr:ABC transporter permease [Saprospirales bacterium]